MSVEIEIEIKSPISNHDIHELCAYLQKHESQLKNVHVKINDPLPNSMGGWQEAIICAVIGGIAQESFQVFIDKVWDPNILPAIKEGYQKIFSKSAGKEIPGLETMSTFSIGGIKTHFTDNVKGERKVYDNYKFNINPDKTYAVVIGCSEFDYKDKFPDIPPVKGNIEDMYRLLADKRYVGLPQKNIHTSFNKPAHDIERLLVEVSRTNDIETLVIYYAGHGHQAGAKDLYFATPVSVYYDDPTTIFGALKYLDIQEKILRRSPAKQQILIFDACHSGLATQSGSNELYGINIEGSYVLASSAGDELSYFAPQDRNTYFTAALVESLENGIDQSKEMISLQDLYEITKEKLLNRRFPSPVQKVDINIPAQKFFISKNPAFSVEYLKQKPKQLFASGQYEDALIEARILMRLYPDDQELKQMCDSYSEESTYHRLVQEGHDLFYHQKDYHTAAGKYGRALQIKETDTTVKNNLRKCNRELEKEIKGKDEASGTPRIQQNSTKEKSAVKKSEPITDSPRTATYKPQVEKQPVTKPKPLQKVKKTGPAVISNMNKVKVIAVIIGLGITIAAVYANRKPDTVPNEIIDNDIVAIQKADSLYRIHQYEQAFELYITHITLLDSSQVFHLAKMYEDGNGVGKNYKTAKKWYEKAANMSNSDAMNNLGNLYRIGQGVTTDYRLAKKWYEKAASLGNSTAMGNLGSLYQKGMLDTSNYVLAKIWYEKAASLGNSTAMNNIGTLYHSGLGVTVNYVLAKIWYEKAASLGNSFAMYNIGLLYQNGEGVTKNDAKALEWYQKSADLGMKDAKEALTDLNNNHEERITGY